MPAERTPPRPRRRVAGSAAPQAHPSADAALESTPGQADATAARLDSCEPDEPADVWPTYFAALTVAEELADEPDTALATPTCPPHHWLVQDSADPDMLLFTCLRCAARRDQPRGPEPDQRTWAERARRNAPAPSFGQS
jgi:hypothetical protein